MRLLMICTSIIGEGDTSGSPIRAKRFSEQFKKQGIKVTMIKPLIKIRIHPLINFLLNFICSLPNLIRRCDMVYSISDLFPDAMFGILYKLTHKVSFTCGCHSLVQRHIKGRTPLHSFYSYHSQQIILWFLKHIADRVLVSNNYDREILRKRGFRKVITVYAAPNV